MKQIPFLLQRISPEISFNDIETQNMHLSPSASKLFKSLIKDHNSGKTIMVSVNPQDRTQTYLNNKPPHIKRQQFKHYLDL